MYALEALMKRFKKTVESLHTGGGKQFDDFRGIWQDHTADGHA